MGDSRLVNKRAVIMHPAQERIAWLVNRMRSHTWSVTVESDYEKAAAQCSRAAKDATLDFVFTEAFVPGTDSHCGLDLLREIAVCWPGTVLVAIIGDNDIRHANEAVRACADAYIFDTTDHDEAWDRIAAAYAWKRLPEAQKRLPNFVEKELNVGISIVDRSYCVRNTNEYQKSISTPGVQIPGICWIEYNGATKQREPCAWCPVRSTFEDGQQHTSTTISPVLGRTHFFEVMAIPIKDEDAGQTIAAAEVVRDVTTQMVRDCRAAVLEGEDAFRAVLVGLLGRICHLGLDRSRLWIVTGDSHYLEGFASFGPHEGIDIRGLRLDLETDPYSRETMEAEGVIRHEDRPEATDSAIHDSHRKIHAKGLPWLELPLKVRSASGVWTFVGKLSFDNEVTGRELPQEKQTGELLQEYGAILAPIVAQARDYWVREERAKRARVLRQLDLDLAKASAIDDQMQAIVKTAHFLLSPSHCHIRHRHGDMLVLKASVGDIPWRLRPCVSIENDKDISISASLANATGGEKHLIWHEKEIKTLIRNLKGEGRLETARHFEAIRSCGAFALSAKGVLIGALVIDSQKQYFFDADTVSSIKDLVTRAQVLLESNLRRIHLGNLLNSLSFEVAVVDRSGAVEMGNKAWNERLAHFAAGAPPIHEPYSRTARCTGGRTADFDKMVESVFRTGKVAHLIAMFATWRGVDVEKDVTISAFDVGLDGKVHSVVLALTDRHDPIEFQEVTKEYMLTRDLSKNLATPIERIRLATDADRVVVVEFLGIHDSEEHVFVWNVSDRRDLPTGPVEKDVAAIGGVGFLKQRILEDKYLAVSDAERATFLPSTLRNAFLTQLKTRSFLAVPVFVQGLEWGALVVQYSERHDFSGSDVDLLHDAAAKLGIIVHQSYLKDFRYIEQQLVEETNVLKSILEHVLRLMTCYGGHIRVVDWANNEVVMTAACNPYKLEGKPTFRERIGLNKPVAGIVVASGRPYIVQDVDEDMYQRELLNTVPQDRDDIREYLQRERGYVCCPLVLGDEILGTFALSATQAHHFTPWRLGILEAFMDSIAPVLRAAQSVERIQAVVRRVDEILKISRLTDLWLKIPEIAVWLFRAEKAEFSSYDPHTDVLRHEGCSYAIPHDLDKHEENHSETHPSDEPHCGFRRYVAKTRKTLRLAGEEACKHAYRSERGEGHYARVTLRSVLVAPLETPDGNLLGVLRLENRRGRISAEGFTEFDEALISLFTTKLAMAIERLQLLEDRNRVVISRTHDFKPPLQAIRGVLECLREQVYKLPENVEKVDLALESAKLLETFIVNTLDVAEGRIPPQRFRGELIDTSKLIEEVRSVFSSFCQQDGWEIEASVDPCASSLFGDRNMLFRILLNLVDNARKHAILSLARTDASSERRRVNIQVRGEGTRCTVSVSDYGPGIDERLRDIVFDPGWARSEASPKMVGGIGLPAVRMLAQVHGGTVQISDRRDGESGAVITVSWDQEQLQNRK